jgi:phage replication-related protein YjqB (UPF0714/DUF867 family)
LPLGNGTGGLYSQNPAESRLSWRSGPRIRRDDGNVVLQRARPQRRVARTHFGTAVRGACKPVEVDLAELLRMQGVREECILRSNVGFMALHGGSQDRGTAEMARRAADRAGASYYAILQPPDLRVHLTSRLHNPDHSASLQAFLNHVDIAISVHGFGREGFALWFDADRGLIIEPYGPALQGKQSGPLRGIILGGLNAQLLDSARQLFQGRFAGYHVADERIRLGFHPDNPVNLPSAHGVQVELPPGLRGIGGFGEIWVPQEDRVVIEMVAALVDLAARATALLRTTGVAKRLDVSRGTT